MREDLRRWICSASKITYFAEIRRGGRVGKTWKCEAHLEGMIVLGFRVAGLADDVLEALSGNRHRKEVVRDTSCRARESEVPSWDVLFSAIVECLMGRKGIEVVGYKYS